MLTQVIVFNDRNDDLTLPFQDISNGFAIESIEGLDPVKATLVSSPFAQLDGSQFQASRREARNIVLTLSFEPDYVTGSVEELRDVLYNFFMTETRVRLKFIRTDKPDVEIAGTVESFDAPRFLQQLKASISVMCFSPDFLELTTEVFSDDTVVPSTSTGADLEYFGSVETGVKITLDVNRTIPIDDTLTVYFDDPAGNTRQMNFAYDMLTGDELIISTLTGSKSATIMRGGSPINVLHALTPNSTWVNLFRGVNQVRLSLEGAAVPFTIEYVTKHGGV